MSCVTKLKIWKYFFNFIFPLAIAEMFFSPKKFKVNKPVECFLKILSISASDKYFLHRPQVIYGEILLKQCRG